MAKSSNLNIRVDPEIKAQVERLYANFGMNVSDAVNIFLHQSLIYGGLPFDVRLEIPNAETIAAMKEADEMRLNPSAYKAYTDVDEMMKELLT